MFNDKLEVNSNEPHVIIMRPEKYRVEDKMVLAETVKTQAPWHGSGRPIKSLGIEWSSIPMFVSLIINQAHQVTALFKLAEFRSQERVRVKTRRLPDFGVSGRRRWNGLENRL